MDDPFRLMVEGITAYAIFMLDPGGRISSWNPGAQRIKGYQAEEVIGRHFSLFYLPEDIASGKPERELEIAIRDGYFEEEGWRLTKGGGRIWASVTITPVFSVGVGLVGFVKVTRDVTERKRESDARAAAEDEVRRSLEAQLRQAQKMEAFGQLAGGVAHDFNNLLTVINGYGELLLEEMPLTDSRRAMVEEIHGAGERAAALTQQLLAFSRQQVLAPKIVKLDSVVANIGSLLRRVIGEDIELVTVLRQNLPKVRIDAGQLGQVILNLAVNARDAMPNGGKLTIETGEVFLDEGYSAKHFEIVPGPHVLVAVTDTGFGMSAETKEKVFEPFFTTKEIGKGTGLGLAVVHGFIKQSGGSVEVYSEVGGGTTFKVYLPAVVAETVKEAGRGAVAPSRRGSETILLVEDEDSVRDLAERALRSFGYSVIAASRGPLALELVQDRLDDIDLMVTDVVMPVMSGRELAEALSARKPGFKVLFVSGYADDAVVRHGVLSENVAFLQKPYTPNSLARRVREVLDQSD